LSAVATGTCGWLATANLVSWLAMAKRLYG